MEYLQQMGGHIKYNQLAGRIKSLKKVEHS